MVVVLHGCDPAAYLGAYMVMTQLNSGDVEERNRVHSSFETKARANLHR